MLLVIVVVVTAAVVAAIGAMSRRQLRSTWEGVVVQIQDYLDEDEESGVRRRKSIAYREGSGKLGHFLVDVPDFDRHYAGLAVGDRVTKHAGEREPRWSKAGE